MDPPETRETEAGGTAQGNNPRQQRSSIPSFLFISFVIFMLTNNRGDEIVLRNQYKEAMESMQIQLANYSAWLNGTIPKFTDLQLENDTTVMPLVNSLVAWGSRLDPFKSSYYSNFTGFWKGEVQFYNLTALHNVSSDQSSFPAWYHLADEFMVNSNTTNATELAGRLGNWNWAASDKFTMSIRDKIVSPIKGLDLEAPKDASIIHGKIDLSDPGSSEELRIEFDGLHFLANGSIFTMGEPTGQFIDLRQVSYLIPRHRVKDTGRLIQLEYATRMFKLQERMRLGTFEPDFPGEGPTSRCSFKFFGQVDPTNIPQYLMEELEEEIDKPTGITTVPAPPFTMEGILISKNCGIMYEIKEANGVKSQSLYRKITTYAGTATIVNLFLLFLLSRQITRSRTATGLARVSRYPFLIQSLVDAVSFVGHITMAIIADGRPSISVLAPAGVSCILFVYEAQFAVLIGQIQAPEDAVTPAPRTVAPTTPPIQPPQPTRTTTAGDGGESENVPAIAVTPPIPIQQPPPAPIELAEPPRTFIRFVIHHIWADPGARLWMIMSFCLIVVFRVVVILSLPLLFVGLLYTLMWTAQIYRSVRKGRSSGLHAEFIIGMTVGRLFFLLYFLVCPKNMLDVNPRNWIWIVVSLMALQVGFMLLQESFGPTFFLPRRLAQTQSYDYHPSIPLPDSEAPEQSLGDCSICMDAILVDPSLRQRNDDEKEHLLGLSKWGQSATARKSYSLAPCHHLFHTSCLEKWLAIKNICPQCRRPLPPL